MYAAPVVSMLGMLILAMSRVVMAFVEGKFHRPSPGGQGLLDGSAKEGPARLSRSMFGPRWSTFILLFHYYTPLYLAFAFLILNELRNTLKVMIDTQWLDPDVIRAAFQNEQDLPEWWENELSHVLGGGSSYLRVLSLISPLFMLITFAISLCNTVRHVLAVHKKGGGVFGNTGHDSAIIIIALPMIYSFMAFSCVQMMWYACTNARGGIMDTVVDFDQRHSWVARLVMCQLMYKTNFIVADLYEAWALSRFAWLTLKVIGSHRKKRARASCSSQPGDQAQESIEALTMQGIQLFIASCLVEAAYYLVTTSVEAYGGLSTLKFTKGVKHIDHKVHWFFLGMGSVASTAAIGNVVIVEFTFHELLEAFKPACKFWSTKVLVSLGFLQSLLLFLPPVNKLSVTESNLLYASLLCWECLGVSLLTWIAWSPAEEWYDTLEAFLRPQYAPPEPVHHIELQEIAAMHGSATESTSEVNQSSG